MNPSSLKKLLQQLHLGAIKPDEAFEQLKKLPYENLGFANIDHHRALRKGFPEVIYCAGKTVEQVCAIARRIISAGNDLLATRASQEIYEAVKQADSRAVYNAIAGTIVLKQHKKRPTVGVVLITSAGTSDMPVAEEAAVTAETLGSRVERLYDVGVAGLHRLLDNKEKLLKARVIVVVAGMDGALASVIGGLVDKPVVAVPTSVGYGASFGGISALLAMLNSCAAGVATVNIDNGFGAGCMAHMINMIGEKK